MLYLGATPGEMGKIPSFPGKPAYMACHFSQSGAGLSNLPQTLPQGCLLLVDDSLPPADHDPGLVVKQLGGCVQALGAAGVYLDFQRPGLEVLQKIAAMAQALPCPVAISSHYSQGNDLALVLPPVPPGLSLEKHIAPWKDRELWLEVALDTRTLTLTKAGCRESPCPCIPDQGFRDERLCCHYRTQAEKDRAIFHLWRTWEDLRTLMTRSGALGIQHHLGLWQELAPFLP